MSDDIVREFLVESSENLDLLDRELINLEKDPGNRGTLASIFRTIHTIKGTCGFLGFTKLESVAHVGENLLSKLRDGELALNPEMTTALLAMVDAIRQMLASVEAIGNEGERNDQELIQTLTRLLQGTAAATLKTDAPAAPPVALVEPTPPEPVAPTPADSAAPPPVEPLAAPVPIAETAPKTEAKPEPAEHAADHGPQRRPILPRSPSPAPPPAKAPSASTLRCSTS